MQIRETNTRTHKSRKENKRETERETHRDRERQTERERELFTKQPQCAAFREKDAMFFFSL